MLRWQRSSLSDLFSKRFTQLKENSANLACKITHVYSYDKIIPHIRIRRPTIHTSQSVWVDVSVCRHAMMYRQGFVSFQDLDVVRHVSHGEDGLSFSSCVTRCNASVYFYILVV